MVIFVLTYCLPQPQHHAQGALARVSLALRAFLEPICGQELYKQLAIQPGQLGCIAPTATLQATPRPLKRATKPCFAPRKWLNSRGSFSSQHVDAFLTCLKAKIDKLYALYLFAFSFPGTFEKTQYITITLCANIPL